MGESETGEWVQSGRAFSAAEIAQIRETVAWLPGLKYSDDDTDAARLGKLLRLGLLPQGYIYPKAERAVRDLLRRRLRLVQQHTGEHPGGAEPVLAQPRALHQRQ